MAFDGRLVSTSADAAIYELFLQESAKQIFLDKLGPQNSASWKAFVSNGGLFIPTNSNYRIGDEVFMLLNLMGEDEKLPVAGRVIWLTPKGAQGKRTAGIGVQFSDQDRGQTQKKIETYLAGALAGDKATHTM